MNARPLMLVVAVLFAFNLCFAQQDEASRAMNQPVKPYRVIGNIYYVGASDVSSFLITTPNGHILLDGGFIETVPQIKQNLAQLGFRLEDIKILLNSHAHYDHAGGLAELKRLTGAKLMTSEGDVALLSRGGKGDPNFGDRFLFEPVKPDRVLRDGDKVELGGVTMVARMTPGHTKGCTSWTMKVKDAGAENGKGGKEYNVVFVGSTSAPGYKLVNNPGYPGIVADYEKTFRLLKSLACDVFLAAHGQFYGMLDKAKLLDQSPTQNPFIDPDGYRRYLDAAEKSFKNLLASQRQRAQKQEKSPDFQRFPIVDFSAREPKDLAEREKRSKKGKKYNVKYMSPLNDSVDSMFLNVDWDVNLPALPIEKSAAVVIGRVNKAEAHLSEDKTGIYSEFTLQIEAIFKNDANNPLLNEKSIFVYRTGGRLRFPSGKILVSAVTHQEMPQPGGRYLLFLTHNRLSSGEDEDFHILTGYELKNGQAFPLDNVSSAHPMSKYRGAS